MSSDVMIVCKALGSDFESGDKEDKAIFIDEASMGCPWSSFGTWIVDYLWKCRNKRLDGYCINEIIEASKKLGKHECFNQKEFFKEIEALRGEYIKTENW